MSDNGKEAEAEMAKAIFISADDWLKVFDLLSPRQLGLEIALISRRFNIYVDEHFKTRKWALKFIRIGSKIGENGTKEMEITNYDGEELPIPKIDVPHKVIGFECIIIKFIDRNAIAFLRRFRQLFAKCPIHLCISFVPFRALELLWQNIWPMIEAKICGMQLSVGTFHRLRHFEPSILNNCPSLRFFTFYGADLFPEFPADDSAMASGGHALAKWLFTLHPENVPKVYKCSFGGIKKSVQLKIGAFKTPFAMASSPANFIVVIDVSANSAHSVELFNLTHESTPEQLILKGTTDHSDCFLLIRCPIVHDTNKWAKWEEEAIGWNFIDQKDRIDIQINEDDIVDDLNETPGPSDQWK